MYADDFDEKQKEQFDQKEEQKEESKEEAAEEKKDEYTKGMHCRVAEQSSMIKTGRSSLALLKIVLSTSSMALTSQRWDAEK